MLPNVSGLRLDDRRRVPCMAPVRRESREEQLANHMASFVYRPTLEDQIKATECELCMEPMGVNTSNATMPRAAAAQATPFYVDYCGNGHYFHKWCARTLLLNAETTACPNCRAEPDDNARIAIAESYPMPEAGASAPSSPESGPVNLQLDADDYALVEENTGLATGTYTRRRDIIERQSGEYPGIPARGSDTWNNEVREAWNRWARGQYPDNPTPQPVSPMDLNDGSTAGARRMRSVVAYAVDALYNSTQTLLTSRPGSDEWTGAMITLAAQLEPLVLTRLHADTATLMREYGQIYFLATSRMQLLRERGKVRTMVANMALCFEILMGTEGNTGMKEAVVRFMSALMIDDALDPDSPHLLGFDSRNTFGPEFEGFWSALRAFETERNTPVPTEFGDLTQHASDLLLVHMPSSLLQRLQQERLQQERPNPRDRSTVRWRFWLKGDAMRHELEELKERMKANFIGAMRYDVPEFESIVPPGSDMFEGLSIISQYEDMSPPGTSGWDMWMGTYHFEFALNLPTHVANAFLDVVSARLSRGDTWSTLVEDWFRYGPIHWQRGRDEPRILIWRPFSAPEPRMTREQFDAWPHWRYIQREPRFRAIGEDRQ